MARNDSSRERDGRRFLRAAPGLSSKYLARTRPERISRRREDNIGFKFFLYLIASLAGVGLFVVLGTAYTAYAQYTSDLPPVTELSNRLSFKTTQIYDRNGTLIDEVYDEDGGKRTLIHLADISPQLIDATLATEDKDFYSNVGIDPAGFARAISTNINEGQIVSGASTITQQLAKNVLLSQEASERSYVRKIREAILAIRISQQYSKNEILEMYLNEVYYGHLSYGIEAAAQTYFGRGANDLSLAESALLAGLPQAPSLYDPFINFDKAKERQAHVLNRMVAEGYITAEDASGAERDTLHLRPQQEINLQAPHFSMWVRQLLEQKYGPNLLYRGGLRVTTTLDLRYNRLAENAIRDQLQYLVKQNANNAALVSIDPKTGEIIAMVGSKDYYDDKIAGQVNVALARRQPGSTIKPIVYVTAFSKGWAPATLITDEPVAFPNVYDYLPMYQPFNYDNKFDGPMTIRHALSNSKNIPAVKALQYVGVTDFLKVAEEFGISFVNPQIYGLSLALGGGEARPLDMAGAYAALDNGGVYLEPVAILKVEDAEGRVLDEYQPPPGRQVVSPVQAYMVTSILSDNYARTPLQGPNSPLRLSRPAAAKTGSTDNYKDSWTIGYTPDLATAVWVGNTDNAPMKEVLGSLGAGRIWHQYMEDVHAGTPVRDFVAPPSLKEYKVCRDTARAPTLDCEELLVEVYPQTYDYVKVADVPGLLPRSAGRAPFRSGGPLGEMVSPSGAALQPTPTLEPGAPTPTPEPANAPAATPTAPAPAPAASAPGVPSPTPGTAPQPTATAGAAPQPAAATASPTPVGGRPAPPAAPVQATRP